MEITDTQEKEIKDQLFKQIENLPKEQKEQTKKQIEEMSKEELAKLIKKNQSNETLKEGECLFCAIKDERMHSIKVDENDEAICVMDINPISRGHVLIIPKDHDKEPSQKSQELAFSVGGRILKTLSPKDITTRAAKVMDHTILNVIPIYEDTDFEKRIKVTENELVEIAQKISEIEQEKKVVKLKSKTPPIEPKAPVCIFCSIINENTPSYKIDENEDNIAILEINPISKGHTIIVPRIHTEIEQIPKSTFALAKKIEKKIKSKYNANNIKTSPTSINNHAIIELIPSYDGDDDDTDESKQEKITESTLKKIQDELKINEGEDATSTNSKKDEKKHLTLPNSKYPTLPQMRPRIP